MKMTKNAGLLKTIEWLALGVAMAAILCGLVFSRAAFYWIALLGIAMAGFALLASAKSYRAVQHLMTSMRGQAKILEKIATGAPLADVFDEMVEAIETRFPGSIAAILLLDPLKQTLHLGSARRLPPALQRIIEHAGKGFHSALRDVSAIERNSVVVDDVGRDPNLQHIREPLLTNGLRAYWSHPIHNSKGDVVGTFALYFSKPKSPTSYELAVLRQYAYVTGLAIERNHLDEQNHQLAYFDQLTGLPNRRLLDDRLAVALNQARRYRRNPAVMFLDLDHFKDINDALGHHVGDAVLKKIAHRIQSHVRDVDTVARLGGDEFVVLIPESDERDVLQIADRILQLVQKPVQVDAHQLRLTASIGIACYPADGKDAETLMKNADSAMYFAKKSGRNVAKAYRPCLNQQSWVRLNLVDELNRAIEREEFCLYYQPRVHVHTGVTSVEALLRWNHPSRGLVLPGEFIGMAEETGLIVSIGEYVLRMACRQIRQWLDAGMTPLPVAVNVSPVQFGDQLIEQIRAVVDEYQIDPKWLEIEITETVLMQNEGAAPGILSALKEMGLRIAMDDFGVGYSSLGLLHRFPVDALKIDRTFVRNTADRADARAIVSAMIGLSKSLAIDVIAEGVETEEQVRFLDSEGCQHMQGFYFYRPMSREEFEERVLKAAVRR